jgi:hypothetical protein
VPVEIDVTVTPLLTAPVVIVSAVLVAVPAARAQTGLTARTEVESRNAHNAVMGKRCRLEVLVLL